MSLYEAFDNKFDARYLNPSVQKVSNFITETRILLEVIAGSSRPITHLQILTYTKVAQRVLTWKLGDRNTLMNLLWHLASEISKSFGHVYPQNKFPRGGGRSMPTFINLLGELTLESYYIFMRVNPIEASFFARNGWPMIVGELTNVNVIKFFSEFLNRSCINDSVYVVSKSISFLTVSDLSLRAIMVFLSSKCGTAYERIWDEAKEDILKMFHLALTEGKEMNEKLRPLCFGTIPESKEFTYLTCMQLRGWRPPGEAYLALYNSYRQKYLRLFVADSIDYDSTEYITVEKEFGYFLDKILLDFSYNGLRLNKKCLVIFTTMTEQHFKMSVKPLVHFVKSLYNLCMETEFRFYYENKSIEQFKILLQYQALGDALVTMLLLNSHSPNDPRNFTKKRLWLPMRATTILIGVKSVLTRKNEQ